jgi:hypothetical protein
MLTRCDPLQLTPDEMVAALWNWSMISVGGVGSTAAVVFNMPEITEGH